MKITREHVLKMASLSKIAITEEEIESLTEDMAKIIDFVEKINEVDTENVKPFSSVLDTVNRYRKDEPQTSLPLEEVEKLVPQYASGHIVVPPVIE